MKEKAWTNIIYWLTMNLFSFHLQSQQKKYVIKMDQWTKQIAKNASFFISKISRRITKNKLFWYLN